MKTEYSRYVTTVDKVKDEETYQDDYIPKNDKKDSNAKRRRCTRSYHCNDSYNDINKSNNLYVMQTTHSTVPG